MNYIAGKKGSYFFHFPKHPVVEILCDSMWFVFPKKQEMRILLPFFQFPKHRIEHFNSIHICCSLHISGNGHIYFPSFISRSTEKLREYVFFLSANMRGNKDLICLSFHFPKHQMVQIIRVFAWLTLGEIKHLVSLLSFSETLSTWSHMCFFFTYSIKENKHLKYLL